MSRIAKYPVALPKGVELNIASGQISIKGPLGTIARAADPNVEVKKDGEQILFKALGNSNHANAMSGTMRARNVRKAVERAVDAVKHSRKTQIAVAATAAGVGATAAGIARWEERRGG